MDFEQRPRCKSDVKKSDPITSREAGRVRCFEGGRVEEDWRENETPRLLLELFCESVHVLAIK